MRIGLMIGDGGDVQRAINTVVDAENDGFDNAWFGQVFNADVMTIIALAGQRTSRIEMGTAVGPTYLRHPFAMAQQALTVQAASGGRFVLGMGLSHQPVVENMWGLSYERPAKHMREYVSIVRPLLEQGRVSFAGEMFRTTAGLQVTVPKPPPLLIAALAPLMLNIAGELCDGTITWMTGVKTIETHVAPKINAAAQAAGRPKPRIVVGLPVAVTEDVAGAREVAAKGLAMYGTLTNYRRMLDKEGAAGPGDVIIAGDEASVERQLRALAAAGATDFDAVVLPVGDDPKASIARTRELLTSLVGKIRAPR